MPLNVSVGPDPDLMQASRFPRNFCRSALLISASNEVQGISCRAEYIGAARLLEARGVGGARPSSVVRLPLFAQIAVAPGWHL